MDPLTMALVAGGTSLLSGIFGNKAAKKQAKRQAAENARVEALNRAAIAEKNAADKALAKKLSKTPLLEKGGVYTDMYTTNESTNSVDWEGMMAAAEASGINPITFIRNGGLAAYARSKNTQHEKGAVESWSKTMGHNAAAAAQLESPTIYQATPNQIPNTGSTAGAVANAVSDGFQAYARQANHIDTQNFQRELLNTQLQAMSDRQDKSLASRSFYTPGFSTSGSTISIKGAGGLSKMPITPAPFVPGDPSKVTNPDAPHWLFSKADPTVPDVSAVTDRHGEPGEWLYAPFSFANQFWYNVTGKTSQERRKMFDSFIGGLGSVKKTEKPANFSISW